MHSAISWFSRRLESNQSHFPLLFEANYHILINTKGKRLSKEMSFELSASPFSANKPISRENSPICTET